MKRPRRDILAGSFLCAKALCPRTQKRVGCSPAGALAIARIPGSARVRLCGCAHVCPWPECSPQAHGYTYAAMQPDPCTEMQPAGTRIHGFSGAPACASARVRFSSCTLRARSPSPSPAYSPKYAAISRMRAPCSTPKGQRASQWPHCLHAEACTSRSR